MKQKVDKSRNKIKVQDWKKYRPESFSPTDAYYIKVASAIYKEIRSLMDTEPSVWSKECLKEIAIAAASYLEDTVSGLGIFQSFREKHKELYDTYIPFYMRNPFTPESCEDKDKTVVECKESRKYDPSCDYTEDADNFQDVLFLIWYITCVNYADSGIVFPQNLNILFIAYKVFDILSMEYEKAPPNTEYAKYFARIPDHADPAWMRPFCFTIASRNYLYGPDILTRFEKYTANEKSESESVNMPQHMYRYLSETVFSLKVRSRLLTLNIFEIADGIARHHPCYHPDVFRIDPEYFVFSQFKIIAVHETNVEIEHSATGSIIDVELYSFPDPSTIKPQQHVSLGVLKKDTHWYFCGISIIHTRDAEPSSSDELAVSAEKCLLDETTEQSVWDMLGSMHKVFRELHGQNLLFLTPQEAEKTTGQFFRMHTDKMRAEKNMERLKNYPDFTFGAHMLADSDNMIVYFNPKSGIELYPHIAQSIKAENNPFFEAVSEDILFELVYNVDFSTEFYHEIMQLLVSNKSLQDVDVYDWFTLDDFDFLKRFYSPMSYKSKPNMHIV